MFVLRCDVLDVSPRYCVIILLLISELNNRAFMWWLTLHYSNSSGWLDRLQVTEWGKEWGGMGHVLLWLHRCTVLYVYECRCVCLLILKHSCPLSLRPLQTAEVKGPWSSVREGLHYKEMKWKILINKEVRWKERRWKTLAHTDLALRAKTINKTTTAGLLAQGFTETSRPNKTSAKILFKSRGRIEATTRFSCRHETMSWLID